MTYTDFLLYYARKGPVKNFRKSAFRKFCRKTTGRKMTVPCAGGFKMNAVIGDSVDNQIAVHRIYEPGVTRVVEILTPVCGSFVDIGCNIGYFSCLFGTKNPGKCLLCIDPNPRMTERTADNLRLNGISGFTVLTCGIGDKPGVLQLNIPAGRHSLSSFAYVPRKGGPTTTVEAEMRTLSDVLISNEITDGFVKIDTEGFEYQVFRGLSDAAAERVRFILFELSAANLRRAGHPSEKLFSLSAIKAFDVYLIQEDGFIAKTTSLTEVTHPDINTNVLLVKRDEATLAAFSRQLALLNANATTA